MAGPSLEVAPPARKPRAGGIAAVAEVRTNDRLGAVAELTFQSDGCAFPQVSQHLCYAGTATPEDKRFDGIDLVDAIGAPFPLYAGVKCFEGPEPDELARAERTLEQGQDRALEGVLAAWAAGGSALPDGTGVAGALGEVEQAIDDQYLAQGVILMSRGDAVLADTALVRGADGLLTTVNGTPVIASGRVEPGAVYGLGAVTVERSGASSYEVVDPESNTRWALAEAVFAIIVDCGFRVKSTILPGGSGMGIGVTNAVDNGDGTFSLLLTDGSTTDPVALIPGAPGNDGAAPEITFSGTTIVVDGVEGPDLKGDPGTPGADGVVQTIVAGDGIVVDDTDPANPTISAA